MLTRPHACVLALGALLGACHDDSQSGTLVKHPPLSCADAVIEEDPLGAGGLPDLCAFGPRSCFVSGASDGGDTPLSISVDWAPTDDYALVGGDGEVRLLRIDREANKLTKLAIYGDQPGRITVAWSPDGQLALSVSSDVRLFRVTREPPALTELARVVTHAGAILSVSWSPDGRAALTTGKDASVRLMAVGPAEGTLVEVARFTGHTNRVFAASWSPDGKHVLTGGEDGTARMLEVDVQAGTLRELASVAHDAQVVPVAWSPRGDALVGTWVPCHSAVELVALDPSAGTMSVPTTFAHHESGLRALEWSPDGSYAISGGHDDTIRFLARHDGTMRVLDVWPQGVLGVHALSWSPDGQYFLHAASQADRVTLVDARACVVCQRGLELAGP